MTRCNVWRVKCVTLYSIAVVSDKSDEDTDWFSRRLDFVQY
jgi:hypothetical protein